LLREVTVRSGIQLDSVGALSVVEPDRIVSSWESAKEKQK
jgi:hypothetical protein